MAIQLPETLWTEEEFEAAVVAYWEMYEKELAGQEYIKSQVNEELRQGPLRRRSKASVEFRMQNISAVLQKLCHPWLKGYAPLTNVGNKGSKVIKSILLKRKYLNANDYTTTADNLELDKKANNIIAKGQQGRPEGFEKPEKITTSTTGYKRDPAVKAHVMMCAKGICELCGKPGPFPSANGFHFLELHHVTPLAEGGPDTPNNAVALCPNCHSACHFAPNAMELRRILRNKINSISASL